MRRNCRQYPYLVSFQWGRSRQDLGCLQKDFNDRNELRPTRVEVLGQDIGAQEEERLLPLTGISLEEKVKDGPRVEITLGGETVMEERHLTHAVPRVRNIMRKVGQDLREEALLIEDEDGTKTLCSSRHCRNWLIR